VAARVGAGSAGAEGAALIEGESSPLAVLPMCLAKYPVLQRHETLRGEWLLCNRNTSQVAKQGAGGCAATWAEHEASCQLAASASGAQPLL
jgi:hypothetical protein